MLNALIVEDSPMVAERFADLVTIPGRIQLVATCSTEDGGREACDLFAVDLAVIDLQLAQGTGFGVIRKLREKPRRATCIIVITNHAVPALKVAAFEAGADYFLDKSKDIYRLASLAKEFAEKVAA
jgi:two-component system OmpR family response regulator